MDNEGLLKLLLEIRETVDEMIENIDHYHTLRFFSGKLSLLVKSVFSIINTIN